MLFPSSRRLSAVAAGVAAAALLLTACGSSSNSSTSSSSSSAPAAGGASSSAGGGSGAASAGPSGSAPGSAPGSASGSVPITKGGTELAGVTLSVGNKDFSEQEILKQITKQLLEAHGATINDKGTIVGSVNTRKALESGDIDIYWDYTGTGWITYLGNTKPVQGAEAQYAAVRDADLAKNGIVWLPPAPLNNTYAFATPAATAEELKITKLSDIATLPADKQTFCIESEFSTRSDGFPGLKTAYGWTIPDGNVSMLDTGLIYTETANGKTCTFGEVFQTDGRIKGLNLTVMEDDKQFFPAYTGSATLKKATLDAHPQIAGVIAQVSPLLTTETMQGLNAKADVDGDDPEAIAKDWLTAQGLI